VTNCPHEAVCRAWRALDIYWLNAAARLKSRCASHRLRSGQGLEQRISRASLG